MNDPATGTGLEMLYSGKLVKGKALYFETIDGLPVAIHLLRSPKHIPGQRHISGIRPTFDNPGIAIDEFGETVLDLDPVAIAAIALRFAFEYSHLATASERCRDVFDGADLKPYVAVAAQLIDPLGPWIDHDNHEARYDLDSTREARLRRH